MPIAFIILVTGPELMDPRYIEPVQNNVQRIQSRVRAQLLSSSTSSTSSSKSLSTDHPIGMEMLDSPKTPNGFSTSPTQINPG